MINKILRRTKTNNRWNSYTERGKDNREWKGIMKTKIEYLKEELRKEITEYIKEYGNFTNVHGRQDIHNPS